MTLHDYLRESGTTVQAFADSLGVTTTTVYRWMSGRREPSFEIMRTIARNSDFNVTANDWVGLACVADEDAA